MELNEEQKKAIGFNDGPLLIIAGAGTGKTRAITSKILDLIKNGTAKSSEILALTFTEKAANEMLERVDEDMPLSYDEICIKTFHSFSEKILRDYGVEMGIDGSFKILSETSQWLFFKKHLYDFELDYYRPLGTPNKFIKDILKFFEKLKDELISPETYLEYAKKIGGEEGKKVQEFAKVFKKYQELKLAENYMDFADFTFYALELIEKRPNVLTSLREKYKYILVDEFQDTNYAQFQLVLKIAEKYKKITVVGDDDQCIYKWRGASLSNILQFEKYFPDCEKVVLSENYRSTKEILDCAYKLIQNNNPDRLETRLKINKKLNCNVSKSSPVFVHHFGNFLQESSFVAETIKQIKEKEGKEYKDFAILVRNNRLAIPFVDELKYLQIPYQVRNPKGLLSLDEIKDLIAVVKVLANPSDDIAFLRILKMDVFGIAMEEILDIINNSKKEKLFKIVTSGTISVHKMLGELLEFSRKNPVGLTINEFLDKSGHLKNLIEKEKFEEVENINEFAKRVSQFEKTNEEKDVVSFCNYLNLLEDAEATLEADSDFTRDAVQILTAHGAKGLEFDYVFLANVVNGRFPNTERHDNFTIPEELTKEILPEGDFHIQEERRLFYVAMTRAKYGLHISWSDKYEGNKKWKKSVFLDEIGDEKDVNSVSEVEHEETVTAIKKLQKFKEYKKPIFTLPPFKSSKISHSQIETFKTCPLKYNYRYLLKVPTPSSHMENFGNSVHETLKEFYKILKSDEKADFELMKKLYEKNWIPYGYESLEHHETRKQKGLEILANFCKKNSNPWIIPAFIEQPFNLKIGDVFLSGRIDRIDKLADGTYEVIDYKTGRMKEIDATATMQLKIYALACREVLKIKVSKLSLYYLEENEKVSVNFEDSEIDKLYEDIPGIVIDMSTSDFSPKPNPKICAFCPYRIICPAV